MYRPGAAAGKPAAGLLAAQDRPMISGMSRQVSVHLLPSLIPPSGLEGGCAVVIDLLRATTTICHALAAGARAVVPCGDIDEARRVAARFPREQVLLAGERNCVKIDGFDLGNSPGDCTPERVQGRTLVMTTTNGTLALGRATAAERVLAGSLVNLNAVAASAEEDERPLHLVCAGTAGAVTGDDVLCAGAILDCLSSRSQAELQLDDCARMARDWYRLVCSTGSGGLEEELSLTLGGRNLRRAGHTADITTAAAVDSLAVLPEWNRQAGELRAG